jgi:hypothetical protein
LIDAEVKVKSQFAQAIPMMQVPSTVISGGAGGAGGAGTTALTDSMMPLIMFKMLGADSLDDFGKVKSVDPGNRQAISAVVEKAGAVVAKK